MNRGTALCHRTGVVLAWCLVSLLGCASVPPPSETEGLNGVAELPLITGRLSVVVAALPEFDAGSGGVSQSQSLSSSFELRGSAQSGRLDLMSPLGSVLARAHWVTGRAWLQTTQGTRVFTGLDPMAQELLGESLPIGALFDWLRGRPSSAWDSIPSQDPQPRGFSQLGWRVDLSQFEQSIVMAERDRLPRVTLRVRIDAP